MTLREQIEGLVERPIPINSDIISDKLKLIYHVKQLEQAIDTCSIEDVRQRVKACRESIIAIKKLISLCKKANFEIIPNNHENNVVIEYHNKWMLQLGFKVCNGIQSLTPTYWLRVHRLCDQAEKLWAKNPLNR